MEETKYLEIIRWAAGGKAGQKGFVHSRANSFTAIKIQLLPRIMVLEFNSYITFPCKWNPLFLLGLFEPISYLNVSF